MNVGTIFRGREQALQPNWVHMPVAYNGRASSIVVSGTEIKRPKGQIKIDTATPPLWSETRKLDFEVEIAAIVGKDSTIGSPITIEEAE